MYEYELDKKRFGAFVAELRKEKGYTQKELAEKLFLSDKAVSKWETGVSIPDTPLLIPLAEVLGVNVTELLMCKRMETENLLEAGQVEDIVKTAISYGEEKNIRAYQEKSRWPLIYMLSFISACFGVMVAVRNKLVLPELYTAVCLGAAFGAYFCFFVKLKLPKYYDEHKISIYYDAGFRMNMAGIVFRNSNWPHLICLSRIWSCSVLAVYPWFSICMTLFFGESSRIIGLVIFLFLCLGGWVVPMYVVGKKLE